MRYSLVNGRLFTGTEIRADISVQVADGQILSMGQVDPQDSVIDLAGQLLVPGFIDTQVNGGGGFMVNDLPDLAGLQKMVAAHRAYGTTSLLPTFISDSWASMVQVAETQKQAIAAQLPGILGIHFEGPYLAPARRGVHQESYLRSPDPDFLSVIAQQALGKRIVTVAPEAVSADFIQQLVQAGCCVSLGHSNASYEQAKAALAAGANSFTHLFNAMSAFTSRAPGMVGAALEDPNSWCGLIIDGFHVAPATLRVALAAKQTGKMMLVTDAMSCVGAEDKRFSLYGQEIMAEGGRCVTDQGVLAGSDLDMATAVRNAVRLVGIDLAEALRMASLYPAQYLGVDHYLGRIEPGYQADLVLMDADLQVTHSWVNGQSAHHRGPKLI